MQELWILEQCLLTQGAREMKSRRVFAWVGVASLTAIAFAATQIARFAGDSEQAGGSELALTI